jgi:hypothetical protein
LAVRRLHARLILHAGHFTVYRIEVLPTPDSSWRVCSMTPFPVARYSNRLCAAFAGVL